MQNSDQNGITTVLFFADIFGKPGRRAALARLPELKAKYAPDFTIGNAENVAGGRGVNRKTFHELIEGGFDFLTGGNHIFDNREVAEILGKDSRLIRPANFPNPPDLPCPGSGFGILRRGEKSLFVMNLLGRVFMDSVDCPFAAADRVLAEAPKGMPILVDFHADATSEKYAMAWFLDGRVSALVGSHSHVQTADERVLPQGTAYITDVGMTGAFDSVIGVRPAEVIRRFITRRHQPHIPAKENPGISCVVIRIGSDGKAISIERIRESVKLELAEEKDLE